ncbi:MAG: MFS transporter [Alphaproteobacteria bacterium]|nr:MFS transporter [Alphaproteobacteria bacterium]
MGNDAVAGGKIMNNVENLSEKDFSIISWLVSAAFFILMINGTILNTALPSISKSLGVSALEAQSVVISYLLVVAFLLPMSGWLADKFGAKRLFIYSLVLFAFTSVLCGFCNSLGALNFARALQGVGGAMLAPIGRLIIVKIFPRERLVKALSFVMLPALLGPILGPPLGGYIVEYFSWKWIFWLNFPIAGLLAVVAYFKMPKISRNPDDKLDWVGFLTLSFSVVFVCVLTDRTGLIVMSDKAKMFLLFFSFFLFSVFWLHIKKVPHPLFNPKIFEERAFNVGIIGNVITRLGFSAIPLLVPMTLQVALHMSPSKAGTIMLTLGIASIVGKFCVNKIIEALGYRFLLVFNTFLIGFIISLLVFVKEGTGELEIIFVLMLLGFTNSIQFTAMNTLALIDLPKKYANDGNALLSVVIQVGIVLGISCGASSLVVLKELFPQKDVLEVFHLSFMILGGFTMLSSICFFFTPKNAGGYSH